MKSKKILATAMCLCMTVPTCVPYLTANADEPKAVSSLGTVYDIWLYEVSGNGVQINYCSTMAEGAVEVPAEIEGLPVTAIKEGCFASCKITSVKLPDTVKNIGKSAFANCYNLEEVNIPNGIEEIAEETFLNCTSLTKVTLPTSVKTIGIRAFYGCTSLKTSPIPEESELAYIGEQAFQSCSKLKSLTIPDGVTKLPEFAFPDTLQLLTVKNAECTIDEVTAYFSSNRNCIIIAPEKSEAHNFAEKFGYPFQSIDLKAEDFTTGDINLDGKITIADAVSLQQYIFGTKNITPLQYEVVDMNNDERIDTFDFCLMRKYITENSSLISAVDLTVDIKSDSVTGAEIDDTFISGQNQFALSILQNTFSEENLFISPYSVMQALAMTANGAVGNTKEQMEQVLGGVTIDELNKYLYTFRTLQPNEDYCKLKTANSIWYRDDEQRLTVNKEFLKKNADYYGANAYKAPFDNTTVTDINNWVNWHTDNMIDKMLDEINESAVMYLINAVVFDAKWQNPYETYEVGTANFNKADGTVTETEMMYSHENCYIADDNAEGIYRLYEGGKYAFVALMPNESISINDYISSLDSESLHNTIANPKQAYVSAGLPKFSYDYNTELSEVLMNMGMTDAFTNADFSDMAVSSRGNIAISRVLHQTRIEVSEEGTKAAAATIVEANDGEAMVDKFIYLNRPFVYFIIDTETSLPIFSGVFMNPES